MPALVQARGQELADKLDTARQQRYDLVLIDTAPHSSAEKARACTGLSDRVCIPTRPAILDLDAIGASPRLASDSGLGAQTALDG